MIVSVIYTHPGFDTSFVIAGTIADEGVGVITIPVTFGLVFFVLSINDVLSGREMV